MNFATNLIQWKNFTEKQKEAAIFEGYKWVYQAGSGVWRSVGDLPYNNGYVYRLVIEDDKWYYWKDIVDSSGITLGRNIDIESCPIFRPAKPEEVQKQVPRSLKNRIEKKYSGFAVSMLFWETDIKRGECLQMKVETRHAGESTFTHNEAVSMRGFCYYVYHGNDKLCIRGTPIYNSLHPVAVLFNKNLERKL